MKGVILAGGLGTRLAPLTTATNKHLLPIYTKPMIYYPIDTLVKSGITEIMVIVSGPHSGDFISILKNGKEFGLTHLEYAYQEKADGGIADALALAEDFVGNDKVAVILGDNTMDIDMSHHVKTFKHYMSGAWIFVKEVADPTQFGVIRLNEKQAVAEIIEKPLVPPSNYAVIGFYLYDNNVFKYVKECKPSPRGQLEITDVNNMYLSKDALQYRVVFGFWQDAGTFDNLYKANKYWYEKKNGKSES